MTLKFIQESNIIKVLYVFNKYHINAQHYNFIDWLTLWVLNQFTVKKRPLKKQV